MTKIAAIDSRNRESAMIVRGRAMLIHKMRRWLAALALASLASSASPRLAGAEPTPASKAIAEALFQEGRTLAKQQRWEEACPKFAASQEQDPASGTLLRLGECNEKLGKSASAWVAYDEAIQLAKREGNSARVVKAQQHKAELESALSKLTVVISAEALDIEGLTLTRDGVKIDPAVYGLSVPIDPGVVKVEVSAPGYKPLTLEVTLNPSGDRKTLVIPRPEAEPSRVEEPAPRPVSEPKTQPRKPHVLPTNAGMGLRRQLGVAFVSAGLAAVGVGLGLGSHARALEREASSLCPSGACSGDALFERYSDKVDESRRFGVAALALEFGGLASMGAIAVVLLWPSPDAVAAAAAPSTASRLVPYVSLRQDAPMVGLQGSF
jgi:hypothetical protein